MCIFFYVQNYFPIIVNIVCEKGKPIKRQISEYIIQLGENFENAMDMDFEEFNQRMKMRMIIVLSYYFS